MINLAVAESNQGYANTQIPITLILHCILDSTIPSNNDLGVMLTDFTSAAGKEEKTVIIITLTSTH